VEGFAYCHVAPMQLGTEQRIIYCEHANQLDRANTVEDYHDRLDLLGGPILGSSLSSGAARMRSRVRHEAPEDGI
jgi:hypothetical protein